MSLFVSTTYRSTAQQSARSKKREGNAGAGGGGGASGGGGGDNAAAAATKKRKASTPGPDTGKNKLTLRQRHELVKEVQDGGVKAKVAVKYGVSKGYVTKLMMPDNIAKLKKAAEMGLNPEARRVPKPVEAELEQRVLKWIKIARERFMVRADVGRRVG